MDHANSAASTPGLRAAGGPSVARLSGREQSLLWLGLFLLQFMLWTNPGYYSHDELQWAYFASAPTLGQVPWASFTDVATFQYRPVTFNLWLLLSRALFDSPMLFHVLYVGVGTINAVLLAQLLRALPGVSRGQAVAAAVVFVLAPYTAYIHGWIATLADLIWGGCGLWAAVHLARRRQPTGEVDIGLPSLLLVFVLTAIALLAKEAAVVLPGFALLAWMVDARRRAWLAVLLASALPVAIYLALRLSVILYAPRSTSTYDWSLAAIPERVLDYLGFPFVNRSLEVSVMVQHPYAFRLKWAACMGLVWAAIAWRSPRVAVFTVLGMLGSLAPVLILNMSANQYCYVFSAVLAGGIAVAWPTMRWPARGLVAVLVVVQSLHGIQIQREMRIVGKRAAVFLPAVTDLVADHDGPPLRLLPTDRNWLYDRMTHDVPEWHHKPLGGRVVIVDAPPADYRVTQGGKLVPYVDPRKAAESRPGPAWP